MFRKRSPQSSMFEWKNLVPRKTVERLEKSWAEPFRTRGLPLIDEESFAPLYCEDNGRPNQPVEVVFGTLILKEMFNLTDAEALEQLEFNLLWHHALCLSSEDAHLCQKTLHNFRARLMADDKGRLAFTETTDRIIAALGLKVQRQRLDSTHIVSNIATLTRLGLFCETIRVFLEALGREHPLLSKRVSEKLRRRYFHESGDRTRYEDARSKASPRRLDVCARDLYRLHSQFRGTGAADLDEYALLDRLLEEQCETVERKAVPIDEDDDDSGEGGAPVAVKEPKEVKSSSLQTPHDPDVTYSGHKGKGYEVQVTETCDEENVVEMITHVEVTDSCESDADATLPMVEVLEERGQQPEELVADTAYGSGANGVEAECMGTELVSPVGGKSMEMEDLTAEDRTLTGADFTISASHERPTVCPSGQESIRETEQADSPNRIEITFARDKCETCPMYKRCPARAAEDGYVLSVDLVAYNLERRRRAEASGEFAARYAIRAGIEATNSELKRKHGLGKLRVRGRPRVELSVHLKALSCNFKRMVWALLAKNPIPGTLEA